MRDAGILGSLQERLRRFLQDPPATPGGGTDPSAFRAGLVMAIGTLCLTLLHFVVLSGEYQALVADALSDRCAVHPEGVSGAVACTLAPLGRQVAWTAGCWVLYLAIPALVVWFVFHRPLSDFGMSPRGFLRHLPVYLVLAVPVLGLVFWVSHSPAFLGTYPFYRNPEGLIDLALWEVLYLSQFFALEFFFRGFWVHGTRDRLGILSVFAMLAPYVMIHFTKPFREALGALVAGLVLGVLSLRTRSIWGGFFIHGLVAVSMDLAALWQRGWFSRAGT